MRSTKWLYIVGALLWAVVAQGWQSKEHFNVTFDECMAAEVVQPANPAMPWEAIDALAGAEGYNRNGKSDKVNKGETSNWDEAFCKSIASASADADVDAFDDDLAHTQTRYRGGVNFIGLSQDATAANPDNRATTRDPRRVINQDPMTQTTKGG